MKATKNIVGTAKKKVSDTAKRSARIVSMATAMAVSLGLSGDDIKAAQAAFEDMSNTDYKDKAIIIPINPFDGVIA